MMNTHFCTSILYMYNYVYVIRTNDDDDDNLIFFFSQLENSSGDQRELKYNEEILHAKIPNKPPNKRAIKNQKRI